MWGLEEWSWEAVPHVLAGLVTPWFVLIHPVLAVLAFLAFVTYELEEFVEIRDKAHRDLNQYAVGLFIGSVLLLLLTAAHQ